jgi:rhodanese-related sulfurtransferase
VAGPVTPCAMASNSAAATKTPLHTPAGIFVIHLRSDSDLSREHLIGRVEHVMSGDSEAFVSLDGLLAFMNRYAAETLDAQR